MTRPAAQCLPSDPVVPCEFVETLEMELAESKAELERTKKQLLSVIVCDLGYTAESRYGSTPMRHHFAWGLATNGTSRDELNETVANMKAKNESERAWIAANK